MFSEEYTILLQHHLGPFARLVQVTCGLLPWDCPLPRNVILLSLRCATTLLIGIGICLLFFLGGLSLVQRLVAVDCSVRDLILNLIQYLCYPTAIVTFMKFTRKRQSIYTFLQSWKQLEEPLGVVKIVSPIKCYRPLSIFTAIVVVSLSLFFAMSEVADIQASQLFLLFPITRNTKNLLLLRIFTSFILFYCFSLYFFGTMFCSYVYRHLSLVLEKIEQAFVRDVGSELKLRGNAWRLSTLVEFLPSRRLHTAVRPLGYDKNVMERVSRMKALNQLWKRYKHLEILTESANDLLGCILFAYYAIAFFSLCSTLYIFLSELRPSPAKANSIDETEEGLTHFSIAGFFTMIFIAKLLITTLLCSSLPLQCKKFDTTLSNYLQELWIDSEVDEKEYVQNFLHHTRNNVLSATPLGLFSVNISILLSMVSLIVTYVIVLVQTKSQ